MSLHWQSRKVIIIGNHDNISHFIQLKRMGIIEDVRESKTLVIGKDRLFLSHYPYREWPGYYHGAKHLFAHCHGNLEPLPNTCDVGVDVWNYKPVEYNELMKLIEHLKAILSSERLVFDVIKEELLEIKEKYGDAIWNALYGSNGALISKKDAGTYTYTGEQQKALIKNLNERILHIIFCLSLLSSVNRLKSAYKSLIFA